MTGTSLKVSGSGADQTSIFADDTPDSPQQTPQLGFATMAPASEDIDQTFFKALR